MRPILSVLVLNLFILFARADSFLSEFVQSLANPDRLNFLFKMGSDDFVCIDKGTEFLVSSLKLLNNYHNQTSEGFLLSIFDLYQQNEVALNQCQTSFKAVITNLTLLLQNHERILNNLNNYFPVIIQDLGSFISLVKSDRPREAGQLLYSAISHTFAEAYSDRIRDFYNPKKTVKFNPERFYEEFVSIFLFKFFKTSLDRNITDGIAKCMSENAYIIHNPIREELSYEGVLESLLNIPSWLEEIEGCIQSENIDITFAKNFVEFFVKDWKAFTKDAIRYIVLGLGVKQKQFIKIMEELVEGEYFEAGTTFANTISPPFQLAIRSYFKTLQLWKTSPRYFEKNVTAG